MELPKSGEERTQHEGGEMQNGSMDRSGRSPQKTQSNTLRLSKKQNQSRTSNITRMADQQREKQKEKMKKIGGEEKTQPKGDKGMGIYDNLNSLACKRGERTFAGSWMFDRPLDWDLVYEAWVGYVSYCNRHNIVIGRHGEVLNG